VGLQFQAHAVREIDVVRSQDGDIDVVIEGAHAPLQYVGCKDSRFGHIQDFEASGSQAFQKPLQVCGDHAAGKRMGIRQVKHTVLPGFFRCQEFVIDAFSIVGFHPAGRIEIEEISPVELQVETQGAIEDKQEDKQDHPGANSC